MYNLKDKESVVIQIGTRKLGTSIIVDRWWYAHPSDKYIDSHGFQGSHCKDPESFSTSSKISSSFLGGVRTDSFYDLES